jgi:hypothetical protein
MDPSDPTSLAFDDPLRPASPFKSLEVFQNSAADLANLDPDYWGGTRLDGDLPLEHGDSEEEEDQLEWSDPRPPPAVSTDRPSIHPLSFSTIAEPDDSDSEEEEQVGGGSKWLEAAAPTTPPKTRLRAEIKPTAHASASTKAAVVRRAGAAERAPPQHGDPPLPLTQAHGPAPLPTAQVRSTPKRLRAPASVPPVQGSGVSFTRFHLY